MNRHLLQAQRHIFNNVLAIISSCMQLQQMLYNGHDVTGAGLDPLKVTAENHWRNFFLLWNCDIDGVSASSLKHS